MKRLTILAVLLSFVVVSACAPTTTRRSFKENWHDSKMTSKIKWDFGRDKEVEGGNIHVETWRGVVTMTGRAKTDVEKAKAEQIARNIKNVKDVKNYIDVVGEGKIETAKKDANEPFKKPYSYTYTENTAGAAAEPLKEETIVDAPAESVATEVASDPVVEPKKTVAKAKKPAKKAAVTKAPKSPIVVPDANITDEPIIVKQGGGKRQNGVSYEIGKELTKLPESSGQGEKQGQALSSVDDITQQAEMELQELRSKRKSK